MSALVYPDRPTLQQITERIRNDVLSKLSDKDILRRSDDEVYVRVDSLQSHMFHGFLEWALNQCFPQYCDDFMLESHAKLWKVPRKSDAAATGSITLTTVIGSPIAAGTFLRALDGVLYKTTTLTTAVATSTAVDLEAVEKGEAGNRDSGEQLQLVSPVPGVQPIGTAGELSGGTDIEDTEAWRARICEAWRKPPDAGGPNDYVRWAKEVPGVTRAWSYPLALGYNTVLVLFVRDGDDSIFPDSGEVAAVQAYIDALLPLGSVATVLAPEAEAVPYEIHLSPDTPENRNAVIAELDDLHRREAQPGGVLLISHIRQAISNAAGETDHTLVSPVANVTPSSSGKILTRGSMTWS